jgi:PKD repeat protein
LGRAVFTIMLLLLGSSMASAAFVREANAFSRFYVQDLVQATDGSAFNRPGSLVQNPNGSFLLYSGCYDRTDESHYLEVSFSQNGSSWSHPQRLPFSPNCVYPSAILDHNGTYWLAWEHQSSGADSILIASSRDGFDWSDPVQVSAGINSRPSLVEDKNGVYWVAYEDNSFGAEDIIVRSSPDGVHWSGPIYVTDRGDDYCDLMASMMQDADGVYWILMVRVFPVWEGGMRICSSHSQDGLTWSPLVKIETGMESFFPHLAQGASGSYVMVWLEFCYSASGGDNIWISRSDDCVNWTRPQRLTDQEENSLLTCLLADDDEYYIAYDVWKTWNLTYCEERIWIMTVKETPVPPVASFTYSPQPCLLEEEIAFDASASYDVDGQIVSYQWNFGDGTMAADQEVTHAYAFVGNFTVTLTVVDSDGRASTTSRVLWVDIASAFRGPLVISLHGGKTVAAQGVTVSLTIEIENQGVVSETYDLALHVDTDIISVFENITQPGHTFSSLAAFWDTAGFTPGFHTIAVQVVSHQGEIDVFVNALDICVSLPGDVNGDSYVDIFDVVLMADAYGSYAGASRYNGDCDLDGDDDVDIFDIVIAVGNYGKGW